MRRKIFSVTISDCEIQTFRSGGKGGQNQNKTETRVGVMGDAEGGMNAGQYSVQTVL